MPSNPVDWGHLDTPAIMLLLVTARIDDNRIWPATAAHRLAILL
jgi:hypothetical protein